MTLFYDASGPLMRYRDGILRIEDLNPQMTTHWRMSRWEMLRTGVRFIVASFHG